MDVPGVRLRIDLDVLTVDEPVQIGSVDDACDHRPGSGRGSQPDFVITEASMRLLVDASQLR
jgi:hypothetical protein